MAAATPSEGSNSTQTIIVRSITPGFTSLTRSTPRGVMYFRDPPSSLPPPSRPAPIEDVWNDDCAASLKSPRLILSPDIMPSLDSPEKVSQSISGMCRLINPIEGQTMARSWSTSPLQSLADLDLCGGRWAAEWPVGATRLVLFGVPRQLGQTELANLLKKLVDPYSPTFDVISLRLCFGDENISLNPLTHIDTSTGTAASTAPVLASVEFPSEDEARLLWCLSMAGSLKIFGHHLGSLPDPSGYRVFGEAVAAASSPSDFADTKECACCSTSKISPLPNSVTADVLLPFATRSLVDFLNQLARFKRENVQAIWLEEISCALITFPSVAQMNLFCPLTPRYKFSASTHVSVSGGYFKLHNRGSPCIFSPPNIPLSTSYLASIEVTSKAQISSPLCHSLSPESPTDKKKPTFGRPSTVASKKRARTTTGAVSASKNSEPLGNIKQDSSDNKMEEATAIGAQSLEHSNQHDFVRRNQALEVAPISQSAAVEKQQSVREPPLDERTIGAQYQTGHDIPTPRHSKLSDSRRPSTRSTGSTANRLQEQPPAAVKRSRGRPKGHTRRKPE